MTVYYYDLFTGASGGTAGTLLSSTTADSGATWPTSSSYSDGNAVELDGNGGIFSSITGAGFTHHNRIFWKSGRTLRLRLVQYSRVGVKDGQFDFLG